MKALPYYNLYYIILITLTTDSSASSIQSGQFLDLLKRRFDAINDGRTAGQTKLADPRPGPHKLYANGELIYKNCCQLREENPKSGEPKIKAGGSRGENPRIMKFGIILSPSRPRESENVPPNVTLVNNIRKWVWNYALEQLRDEKQSVLYSKFEEEKTFITKTYQKDAIFKLPKYDSGRKDLSRNLDDVCRKITTDIGAVRAYWDYDMLGQNTDFFMVSVKNLEDVVLLAKRCCFGIKQKLGQRVIDLDDLVCFFILKASGNSYFLITAEKLQNRKGKMSLLLGFLENLSLLERKTQLEVSPSLSNIKLGKSQSFKRF